MNQLLCVFEIELCVVAHNWQAAIKMDRIAWRSIFVFDKSECGLLAEQFRMTRPAHTELSHAWTPANWTR